MPLNLPPGSRCFIDANIFVYELIETIPLTKPIHAFLERVASGDITAYTSCIVLTETLHRIMLAEVAEIFRPAVKPLAYVQRHPEIISQLPVYAVAIDRLANLGIRLLPVDESCLKYAGAIAASHRLLTNDACIIAAMSVNRIQDLVTNDDDFDLVPGITPWKPR